MILPVVVGVQMTTPAATFLDGRLPFSASTDKMYDEVERLVGVHPGGVIRVAGSNEILVAFHFEGGVFTRTNGEEFTLVAKPNGKTFQVTKLGLPDGYRVESASVSHGRLVVLGEWPGHVTRPFAATFASVDGSWRPSQFQDVSFESWYDLDFRGRGATKTCTIDGTTYPEHMNVSHSGATVHMRRVFRLRNGWLLPSTEVRISNPMSILDEYLDAVHRHIHVDFSKICSNSSSARGLRLVMPELWGAGWRVGYDRIPHGKATIWANAYSIRFDFRERRGIWKLTSVRHEKPSDSSS
ncbi:MAG: hypothetical protein JST12_06235 [Armatimonadetes bacterium]|nr:hypothetical protein [Armatimonadota bacterium]